MVEYPRIEASHDKPPFVAQKPLGLALWLWPGHARKTLGGADHASVWYARGAALAGCFLDFPTYPKHMRRRC